MTVGRGGRARVILASVLVLSELRPAVAEITEVHFGAPEPFAEGKSFGGVGSYVRIKGVAKGQLDPKSARNRVIVNLDKAPRNARGMVEYETDVTILRPADPAKGAGTLLYEVTNRGNKVLLLRLHNSSAGQAAVNDAKAAADLGATPIAFERGYTLVWSGWDPDVAATNARLSIRVPVATDNGRPIVQRIREEIQVGTRRPADAEVARLWNRAASTSTNMARMSFRDTANGTRSDVPPDQWAFVDDRAIRLLPEGTKLKPLRIYDVWYDAKDPKLAGIGFAATRDLVSFLRYAEKDGQGNANPLAGTGISRTMAFGVSLGGRYLRHHIELGMNADENGRRVFDGMLAHTGGSGKMFANHAFAQTDRTATQRQDRFFPESWFPFAFAATTDPLTGKSGGLFRGDDTDPLVIATNTSTEYWQKGASLLTTTPDGVRDLADHPKSRTYLIAGTQHVGNFASPSTPGSCVQPRNPHDAYPTIRALLVALEEWVTIGKPPPESRVPRVADGTALPFEALTLPKIPGMVVPMSDNKLGADIDWVHPPAALEVIYGTRLPAIDADGNETSGIRLPDQAVPLGTFTGWNLYRDAPTDMCDRDGTYFPFAKTKAEREASGDPRLSLQERYGSKDAYVAKLKAAADALVRDRLLLPSDAEAYVKTAMEAKGF
jgi:hypothetical protein